MEKVILKPGDIVKHESLGEGVVTNADEEFCTVKFESRDAMFRLPDAFEDCFLTSDDAVIIDDDDELEEEEELVEETPGSDQSLSEHKKPQKHSNGIRVFTAIFMGIIFIPLGGMLFKLGIDNIDESLAQFLAIIGVIFMLSPLLAFFIDTDRATSHSPGSFFNHSDSDSSSDDFPGQRKGGLFSDPSNDENIRREIYAKQDEDLSILEDMIQMHSVNPDADLEEHYGWEHKIDYDQDGDNDNW